MKRYCLHTWGDYACFTRPEAKGERMSYEVITPSAARAVFESIFWKPAVRWHVRRIEVLRPIRWINLRRNEVKSKASVTAIESAMTTGRDVAIYADDTDERVQRAGLFLKDVAYRLHADMEVRADRTDGEPPQKYHAMFERRARAGQCVNQPYLGCREFAAHFRLVEPGEAVEAPIELSKDLGWMLHDMDFSRPDDPQPVFFPAELVNGVMEVVQERTS